MLALRHDMISRKSGTLDFIRFSTEWTQFSFLAKNLSLKDSRTREDILCLQQLCAQPQPTLALSKPMLIFVHHASDTTALTKLHGNFFIDFGSCRGQNSSSKHRIFFRCENLTWENYQLQSAVKKPQTFPNSCSHLKETRFKHNLRLGAFVPVHYRFCNHILHINKQRKQSFILRTTP